MDGGGLAQIAVHSMGSLQKKKTEIYCSFTNTEKLAEEKTGNYQSSLKGGGGVPHIGKRPIYFRVFLLKASLRQGV